MALNLFEPGLELELEPGLAVRLGLELEPGLEFEPGLELEPGLAVHLGLGLGPGPKMRSIKQTSLARYIQRKNKLQALGLGFSSAWPKMRSIKLTSLAKYI